MHQTGKRGRIERRGNVGRQRAHDVEGLGGLPLVGLVDAAHGELADVKDTLGRYIGAEKKKLVKMSTVRGAFCQGDSLIMIHGRQLP